MTNQVNLQQKAWDSARAAISAKANEKALENAMRRWARMMEAQDDALLDEGFGLFGKADAEKRKQAFMTLTDERDVYRCLLTETYLEDWDEGIVQPPYSEYWKIILEIGGKHMFTRSRREFIRAWNSAARAAGLSEIVYRSSGEPEIEEAY